MRTITLPAVNKTVSLKQYVAAIKMAKMNLDREFKHGLTCWYPCSGRDIVKQFLDGIHDRINEGISYNLRGAS